MGDDASAERVTAATPACGAPILEYTARARVGRVVEIRVRRLRSRLDVQKLSDELYAALGRAGKGAVICADLRRVGPLSREVSDAWSRAMRAANRDITRSCLLLDPTNVTFNLQIERIVRCAGNPERRIFADVDELCVSTERDLTTDEQRAVRDFLQSR